MITLSNILGQALARRILRNSFNRARVASTYLFYGPDGVGKWPAAISLAALLNCEKPLKDESGSIIDACGKCRSCHQIFNLIFPDLIIAAPVPPHKNEKEAGEMLSAYLDDKKKEPYKIITSTRQLTIPIDFTRDIRRRTAISQNAGIKRVIIFYQMEKMLPASADSLLKLIEEPPRDTVIILTAADPGVLLPTIQSRAQKIPFRTLADKEIAQYLEDKYAVPPERAEFFANLAEGSLGRALNYIADDDELSLRQTAFLMFKGLFGGETAQAAATLNEMINPNNRGEVEKIIGLWQSFLSDLIYLKYGGRAVNITNSDLTAELEILAARVPGPEDFVKMLGYLKQITLSLRRNIHIRPAVMALAIRFRRHINQSP
ncbi:putative DNA-directed DNA polymerase [Candidatus Zixiibacteriota bacterium]|nr:putative DNA-directed DNA polymerase [candidate division Zixibacteria bacterium]